VLKLWPKGGCANVKKRWKKKVDFCCFFFMVKLWPRGAMLVLGKDGSRG
jgi:hypothetical protein